MTTRPLGVQISHMLKSRGVDMIFGIPGVHNVEMYRGIEEAGITHVLARHEQGAGFMADGYARATGRPGVAYVITGPGLCNIMTPMGQAYSDSVSVLVLSSCLDETAARRGQLHQMLNQEAAAATVCDWSAEARSAEAAYTLVDRALGEFDSKRPRPKHIQVPIALLGGVAEPAPDVPPGSHATSGGTYAPSDLGTFANQVMAARKPMFIFGGGVRDAALATEVLRRSGAAAYTTYAGCGLLGPDDPMSYGSYLGRPESQRIIGEADLVIVIGSELSECDLWRTELGHTGTLVRVDIDPEVLVDEHRADVTFHADAGMFLQELMQHLPEAAPAKWKAEDILAAKTRFRAETDTDRPGIADICDALADVMPEDAMIFSDMTQIAYVAKEVWDMPRPGHWHHPSGFGTLGYGLPAAIGGAVARPGLPTVCIAGDYGFQYTIQELGTAVELGLPMPILLWDNAKLKEIEDSMVASQIAPNAVVAMNPDFCKLAEAYGAHACEPDSITALQEALLEAFKADRPTLIRMTPALTR
ncbi:5-guanidino-2-oxopentanoate decarboxylase [uncultured Shimia sp.]|uniref:5-guanidino-2-oxopentanoate decarboxylase n=1 Tax=uncultured Shimia sp. TaxID=573152 RepID=UPI00260E5526|nr:5-guanidino-2-oxopentanoate decarboxylase [uncultured Shimia sp.]